MELLIATTNAHKTAEFAVMLGSDWYVRDLRAFPQVQPAEETGTTFEENATLKAVGASCQVPGMLVLADDSGLEVDALHGAPGVRSARYAGEHASDAENRTKLLRELAGRPLAGGTRTARFRCVLALARDGQSLGTWAGAVEGTILDRERGEGGFGYDSLFVPEGHSGTFAELPPETKNDISHRARAFVALAPCLATLPSGRRPASGPS